MPMTRTLRTLLAIAAATLAAAPAASAQNLPSVGSSQVCIGTQGGFLLGINGFGTSFPANTPATSTFVFANGHTVTLTATTNDEGIFHTAQFTLDLRDPQFAALVGTTAVETAVVGGVESSLTFKVVGCPTAPDGKVACMDGGFERYPALGFLNQGDCVSWIATQGKNEPGQNLP